MNNKIVAIAILKSRVIYDINISEQCESTFFGNFENNLLTLIERFLIPGEKL